MESGYPRTKEEQQGIPSQAGDSRPDTALSAAHLKMKGEQGDSDDDVQFVSQYPAHEGACNGNSNRAEPEQPSQQPGQQPLDSSNGGQVVQMRREDVEFLLQEYNTREQESRFWVTQTIKDCLNQVVDTVKGGTSQWLAPQLKTKVIQLQGELEATIREKRGLDSQNQNLISRNAILEQKLQQANERTARALEERDKQRQLADGATLADSAKATDDAIQSKWHQIDYNIRCLAKHLSQFSPDARLEETARSRFRYITPDWHKFLSNPDFAEFLIRGYLWYTIGVKVFGSGNDVWGGDNAYHLKSLKTNLIADIPVVKRPEQTTPSVQQAAKWFAQGSAFLEGIWGRDEQAIRDLVTTETRRLMSSMNIDKSNRDREETRTWNDLKGIIDGALELDLMFMSTKALFATRWIPFPRQPSKTLLYNSNKMSAVAWERTVSPSSRVRFLVSPILHKTGNADGQNYDSHMVVCKAYAVCD